MDFEVCHTGDGQSLAELRARAMRPSLEKVGRFDEGRVRSRFLDSYVAQDSRKILIDGELCGFFVIKQHRDHLYLDHLYVEPVYQNRGIGHAVIAHVVQLAKQLQLPIRLGALRESPANQFYQSIGFVSTHEDAFDIYYQYVPDV